MFEERISVVIPKQPITNKDDLVELFAVSLIGVFNEKIGVFKERAGRFNANNHKKTLLALPKSDVEKFYHWFLNELGEEFAVFTKKSIKNCYAKGKIGLFTNNMDNFIKDIESRLFEYYKTGEYLGITAPVASVPVPIEDYPRLFDQAVKENNSKVAMELIDRGIIARLKSLKDGKISITRSLLEFSEKGNISVVEALLKAGVHANVRDLSGSTALHMAAANGHMKIVKRLMGAGANVHSVTDSKETVLLKAATNGHTQIVDLLINAGVDVNIQDSIERTALYGAVINGHAAIVKKLIQVGANVNISKSGEKMIELASEEGHTNVVKELLKTGISMNKKGSKKDVAEALMKASKNGHSDINNELTNLILEQKVNINEVNGIEAFFNAVEKGHLEIVRQLIKAKVNIHSFAKEDSWHSSNDTALHKAASYGHAHIIEELVKAGIDINQRNRSGCTPLHEAVKNEHVSAVEMLLKLGANIDLKTKSKKSAIKLALEMKSHRKSCANDDKKKDDNQGHRWSMEQYYKCIAIIDILKENGAKMSLLDRICNGIGL